MNPITESALGGVLSGSIVELLKLAMQERRDFEQVFRNILAEQLKARGNKNTAIVDSAIDTLLADPEIQGWLNSPQLPNDLSLLKSLAGKLTLDALLLQDFFLAYETAIAKNPTLDRILQKRYAERGTQYLRELSRLQSGQLTQAQMQALDDYRRRVREQFSSIMLFGDRTRDEESVFARMSDVRDGFVPLHLKPWQNTSPNPLQTGEGQNSLSKNAGRGLEIEDIFFNNRQRLILIRGLPGGGKTTLLRYLTWRYAEESLAILPVYIRLKKLKLDGKRTLEAFIRQELSTTWSNPAIDDALRTRACFLETPMILLLDGIDEIEDSDSAAGFAEALVELAQANKRSNIIVASRPHGLEKEDYPDFLPLDLDALTPDLIEAYLDKWFEGEKEKITALRNTLKDKPRMRALAENPFLLSMICYTFEEKGDAALIAQRSTLYAACTERLLARMYAVDKEIPARVELDKALAMLKDLALRYFLWQEAEFPVDLVNLLAQATLESKTPDLAAGFLDDLQRETGLVQRAQEGYTFVHRTLWEYFTALALLDKNDHHHVIRHAADPDWEEVVRLYAGLLDDDDKVKKLVAGLWNINRPLALRVTTEVQTPAAELLGPHISGETGSQGKLLLIDGLAQSLPLIAEKERQPLVDETLRILLPACREDRESFCEILYHAEQLLEQLNMQPLAKGGLVYDLLDLRNAAQRQKDLLADPSNKFEWIEVEGGEFLMGDDEHHDNEKPVHRVRVNSFRMMKHPVTNKLLSTFPFGAKYPNYGGESHPAIGNTWWEAYYFALWLGLRLPTEAEWEYAARGGKHGSHTQYYFGDAENELPNHAWFGETGRREAFAVDEPNPRTGEENLNPLGLANMHGNVWDWCADWFGNYESPENAEDVIENPQGPKSGTRRVLRGGAFNNN
ncbi:MAG: NACHT domain-containing protein, partial [bacterium]